MADKSTTFAEKSLLGAVLMDQAVLDRVCDIVTPEHFSVPWHSTVYQAMVRINDRGDRVDLVSVAKDLEHHGLLDRVGGIEAVITLDQMGTARLAENHAQIIAGSARVGQVERVALEVASSAQGADHKSANTIIDGAIEKLMSIGDSSDVSLFALGDAVDVALEETKRRSANKSALVGIPTGLKRLDTLLGGYCDSNVYVIAADTGRGKTAFALNAALTAAKAGKKVVYVSLEMHYTDLARRVMSIESKVDGTRIRTGYLTDDEKSELVYGSNALKRIGENLQIIYKPGLHVNALRRVCRRRAASDGVDMVIVDYLQLLSADAGYSRENQVASISLGLLGICADLKVPVLALSQVNKEGMVRESQGIAHSAACVIRIDYDNPEDVRGNPAPDCTIKVLKHRHGDDGNVPATFFRNIQTFAQREESVFG